MKKRLKKTVTCILVGCIITVCLAVIASEMNGGGKFITLGNQEQYEIRLPITGNVLEMILSTFGIIVLLGVPAIFILTSQLMKMLKLLKQSSHEV